MSAATLAATRDVLVVEDDDDVREAVTALLQSQDDLSVVGAANGREAMDYLRAHPAPCVILLDLMMPGVTGWDVLGWLRRDPELADVPVIVVSAAGPTRVREALRLHPSATYLQKPVQGEELLAAVEERCPQA